MLYSWRIRWSRLASVFSKKDIFSGDTGGNVGERPGRCQKGKPLSGESFVLITSSAGGAVIGRSVSMICFFCEEAHDGKK